MKRLTCWAEGCGSQKKVKNTELGALCEEHFKFYYPDYAEALKEKENEPEPESSIPKKPYRFGKVSKALIGRAIRVGYEDGPYEDGIITGVERTVTSISFCILKSEVKGRVGEEWSVDSADQVIDVGEVHMSFTYPVPTE